MVSKQMRVVICFDFLIKISSSSFSLGGGGYAAPAAPAYGGGSSYGGGSGYAAPAAPAYGGGGYGKRTFFCQESFGYF